MRHRGLQRAAPAAAMATGTTTATLTAMPLLLLQRLEALAQALLHLQAMLRLSDGPRQRRWQLPAQPSAHCLSSWRLSCGTKASTAQSALKLCAAVTACGLARRATASSTPPAHALGGTRAQHRALPLSRRHTALAAAWRGAAVQTPGAAPAAPRCSTLRLLPAASAVKCGTLTPTPSSRPTRAARCAASEGRAVCARTGALSRVIRALARPVELWVRSGTAGVSAPATGSAAAPRLTLHLLAAVALAAACCPVVCVCTSVKRRATRGRARLAPTQCFSPATAAGTGMPAHAAQAAAPLDRDSFSLATRGRSRGLDRVMQSLGMRCTPRALR